MTEGLYTILGVITGSIITGLLNYWFQRNQFKHNKEMFILQNKSKEQVKDILIDVLNHKNYAARSFDTLKKRIGGFTEDELRQILYEVGARRTTRKDKSEWWYLKYRYEEVFD